jgi:hypothetical protein
LKNSKILPHPPEAVKKFRQGKIGGPGDVRERLFPPSICIFLQLPFSKVGKGGRNLPSNSQKALLPLKKGGREGFLARPFQSAEGLRVF